MARNYRELRDKVRARPGAPERIAEHHAEAVRQLTLAELRKARSMTQTQLADALEIKQSGISRIERETDLYLSTLRSYCEALGGRLELRFIFEPGVTVAGREADPEDGIVIGGLSDLDREPA